MKKIIAILLASAAVLHADTLTYTFDSGLGASGTSDATATNTTYSPGNNTASTTQSTAQRAWYDQDTSGDDVYWLSARLTDNKGTGDTALSMTLGNPAYVSFPLEVASSNQLDFTGATLDLTGVLYNDTTSTFDMGYQIWAKPSGGSWNLLGATQVITGSTNGAGTGTIYEVDEATTPISNDSMTAGTVLETVSNLTFNISSLGALGQGQGVEIAVALSGTRNNHRGFSSSLDDVVIADFAVNVVEGDPSYLGTLYLGDGIDSYTTSPATWDSTSANWGVIASAASTPWTNWIEGANVVIGVPVVNMETAASFVANKLTWNYDGAVTLSGDGSTTLTITNQIACTAPTSRQLTLDAGTIGGTFSLLNVSRLSFRNYGVEPNTHITMDATSDIQFENGAPADFSDLTVTLGGSSSILLVQDGVDRTVGSLNGIGGIQIASNKTLTITETSIGGNGSVGSLLANGSNAGDLQLGSGTHRFDLIPGTTSSDYISMGTSSLVFGGDLVVQATTTNKLALGEKFQLFEAGTYTGTFNSVTLPTNNLPDGAIFFNDLAADGSISVGTKGMKYSTIRFDQFRNTSTWVPGGVTMFGSITNANGTILTLTASAKNPVGDVLFSNKDDYIQGIDSTTSTNDILYRFDSGNLGDLSDDEQVQLTLSMSGTAVDVLNFSAIGTAYGGNIAKLEVLDANSTSINIISNINTITESDLTGLEVLTKDNVTTWSLDLISREDLDGTQGQWSLDYVEFLVQYQIGSSFQNWAESFGLSGDDAATTNDYDGDLVNNLSEYALGGDPTNAYDRGYTEFYSLEDAGSMYFEYIYAKRTASNSGIAYSLETSDDLIYTPWTDSIPGLIVTSGELDADFDAVTNRIPATDATCFLKLVVEEN